VTELVMALVMELVMELELVTVWGRVMVLEQGLV